MWRFASTNSSYWGTEWHYDLILMPVLFGAAVEALGTLSSSDRPTARWYSQAAPLAMAGLAVIVFALSPAAAVAHPGAWESTPRQRALDAALREIPPGAVVQSDLGILTHLAGRNPVSFLGTANAPLPSYIVTDVTAGWTPPRPEDAPGYFAQLYPGHTWQVAYAADGVVVIRLVPSA